MSCDHEPLRNVECSAAHHARPFPCHHIAFALLLRARLPRSRARPLPRTLPGDSPPHRVLIVIERSLSVCPCSVELVEYEVELGNTTVPLDESRNQATRLPDHVPVERPNLFND